MDIEKIVIELWQRVKTLEAEVTALKFKFNNSNELVQQAELDALQLDNINPTITKRDKTKYKFQDEIYLKNRLVLAVVNAYIKENPNILRYQLKNVFIPTLQGSIGVVENVEIASKRADYTVRFFVAEPITLADGMMFVCNQWGVTNLPKFLVKAKQLGFDIEAIQYD